MIPYHLHQKLFKAGFKKSGNMDNSLFFISENFTIPWRDLKNAKDTLGSEPNWKKMIPYYTLEEIVEACGEDPSKMFEEYINKYIELNK